MPGDPHPPPPERDDREVPDPAPEFDDAEAAGKVQTKIVAPTGSPAFRAFKNLKPVELVSLCSLAILILGGLILFCIGLSSQVPVSAANGMESSLRKPVQGALLGIAAVNSQWREPQPGERIKPGQALIPEITIRLAHSESGSTAPAFLKVVFRNESGSVRGDVTPRHVENGKFADNGAAEMRIFGTEGLEDRMSFLGFTASDQELWTAEILEGREYGSNEWSRLAQLTIASRIGEPEQTPAANGGALPKP